jgi:hypothetical protein
MATNAKVGRPGGRVKNPAAEYTTHALPIASNTLVSGDR